MTTKIWIYLLASGISVWIPLAIETNSVVTSCNIIMIATITGLREGAKEYLLTFAIIGIIRVVVNYCVVVIIFIPPAYASKNLKWNFYSLSLLSPLNIL